jgi:small conductance mechanosensitive channel
MELFEYGNSFFRTGLLGFVINAGITLLVVYFINRAISRGFRHSLQRFPERNSMALRYSENILKAIIWILAAINILSQIKPLQNLGTAILGATSVISVIVGLAAQETFGNFIAGFALAFSQPFKVGDFIRIPEKNVSGTVKAITFRHTVITTVANSELIIPNSVMNTAIIDNTVKSDSSYLVFMSFDLGYDTDIDLAKKLIYKAALSARGYVDTRSEKEKAEGKIPFEIRIDEFDPSGILIKFAVTCENYDASFLTTSDIRTRLLEDFKTNSIEIPYQKIQILK